MAIGSVRSLCLLLLAVVWVALAGSYFIRKAFGSAQAQRRYWAFALVWMGGTFALGWSEVGAVFDSIPPRPIFFLAPIFGLATWMAFGSFGRRLAEGLSINALVFFQAFRIIAELMLWSLYREGVSNRSLTFEGVNFDIATGVGALVLALIGTRGQIPRRIVWIFNIVGLSLLLFVVGVAVLTMPTPFRAFVDGPANVLVVLAPYVWLPTVLVAAAFFVHLLLFRKLRLEQKESARCKPSDCGQGAVDTKS